MHDLILAGGTVIDGSGAAARRADVAITDDRITHVGDLEHESAARRIDVSGLFVAPGFIDTHAHSDISLLASPEARAKIGQGVTTEVIGNCGFSASPLADSTREMAREFAQPVLGNDNFPWDWNSTADYCSALQRRKPAVNVALLIGHGTLRSAVMGFDRRAPTASELEAMQGLLSDAMEDGAFGISTGLCYAPGVFAETDEIVALCRVVAASGGLYATHLRDQSDHLEDSVTEALEIGKQAAVPVLISHHKAAGQRNWGKVQRTLAMLDAARAAGHPTWSDVYPYVTGQSTIVTLLPPWAVEGGVNAMVARLQEPEVRARINREFVTGAPGWENRAGAVGWGAITISSVSSAHNKDLVGLSVLEAAQRRQADPVDFLLDLIVAERGKIGKLNVHSSEEDVLRVLTDPHTMVGSDGLDVVNPHPRQYGCFARVLGEYVRERKAFSWETAIHKMTGLPAAVFGLRDIGLVQAGRRADLVVFDPRAVREQGTYTDPCRHPAGIQWVFVGGVPALAEARFTGERRGTLLRNRPAAAL